MIVIVNIMFQIRAPHAIANFMKKSESTFHRHALVNFTSSVKIRPPVLVHVSSTIHRVMLRAVVMIFL